MNMSILKGKTLRIRPGHLANFSGGAGYMPFIVMFSVPASVLFGILGSLFLHFRGKRLLTVEEGPRVGLHEFARFARLHTLSCLCITIVTGLIFFIFGLSMVYGEKLRYAPVTVVFAVGPLAAWMLSSLVLVRLTARRGAKWTNLLMAALIHLGLIGGCIPLVMLISEITGARV